MTSIPINGTHPLFLVLSYSYLLLIGCLRPNVPKT
jgi:hypothetical protein